MKCGVKGGHEVGCRNDLQHNSWTSDKFEGPLSEDPTSNTAQSPGDDANSGTLLHETSDADAQLLRTDASKTDQPRPTQLKPDSRQAPVEDNEGSGGSAERDSNQTYNNGFTGSNADGTVKSVPYDGDARARKLVASPEPSRANRFLWILAGIFCCCLPNVRKHLKPKSSGPQWEMCEPATSDPQRPADGRNI